MVIKEEPVRPIRVKRRMAVTVAVWVVVAGFVAGTVVRVFGLDDGYPLIQLVAFTPYVAAVSLLVPVGAVLLRRWVAAGVALAVTVTLAAGVLPRAFPDGGVLPTGPTVRVLTANMRVGGADPAVIVGLVRDEHVDLLAIQEYTPEAERALDRAGLSALLPHRSSHPLPGVGGSALYSHFPLVDDGVRMNPYEFGQARATVTVPGAAPFAVESVHTTAPSSAEVTDGLPRSLANEPPATVDGPVRVLLGDFNATLDHAALRRLIGTGYRDAADVTGDGLVMTWPYDKVFPRIALDHVLADRRVGVRRVVVHPLVNTDHRAVYAELVLPPG
jgi:endonuclease/exonuclease/phosphatase (EEP) superfamily protein YafD